MASSAMAPIPERNEPQDELFHRFASTTVHHLNEPVRMIGVYVDMLEAAAGPGLSTDARQSIEFLRNSARQMQSVQ